MKHMKKILLSILTALAVVLLVACSTNNEKNTNSGKTADKVTIKDSQGDTQVPSNPKKIVVFDLGALDTIRNLGKVDSIAGMPTETVPAYLKDLPKSIKNVGTMKEPDLDAIEELQPDLIIASPRTAEYLSKFKEITPTILFKSSEKDYWGSTKTNILSLASLFGDDAKKKAQSELDSLDKEIETVASANEKSDKKALTLMLNEGSMSAFGAKSRFSFLYDSLKFKAPDVKIEDSKHGQEISFEGVKEINPDLIFVVNRTLAIGGDNSSNEGILDNALIQETQAAKDKKIVNLTSDLWYLSGGGLESTKLMIQDVKDLAGK
ncbi:siderophore ABC transporter substrate-binding protein [Streptococcus oricebi]|uniref:Iron ABC transporter substrate-binding protein n=1 Tax=Streptococcus oricebi TaxID=1547447 RepID=A0ABS5B1I7_9STRE|nr:siderophore ABC transporter substrate-binding protein [Streptococcus oricebi]MBP2622690.1 iron ABC transporter substrate-binding protein [Streptococcus oricebi]